MRIPSLTANICDADSVGKAINTRDAKSKPLKSSEDEREGLKRGQSCEEACEERKKIKLESESIVTKSLKGKQNIQVRTIVLQNAKAKSRTPEEESAHRVKIAAILQQATRVALQVSTMYPIESVSNGPTRPRFQRRNSFVDRRGALAAAAARYQSIDSAGLPVLSLPLIQNKEKSLSDGSELPVIELNK